LFNIREGMMEYVSVSTSSPDRNSAKKMAKTVVEERLAACVNIFRMDSLYWWQEKVEEEEEYELVFKTRRVLYPELEKRIRELHPYEVPSILSYSIEEGLKDYLGWIDKETKKS
jgi:periplasmic divalent cation tolerance protein